jgi:fluoride exporter
VRRNTSISISPKSAKRCPMLRILLQEGFINIDIGTLVSVRYCGLLTEHNLEPSAPIAVGLGAIPGALSRYYLTILFSRWLGASFPFGTFFINLSGALLMGFFATLTIERVITQPEVQLAITTGFLGSYTTFSTYALDTSVLMRGRDRAKAFCYWAGSVVFGGICVEIGIALARLLHSGGG